MYRREDDSTLRFVDASRLQTPGGDLAGLEFRGIDDRKIGTLNGVVVDPAARRLRFFVVESQGWFKSRRFLLPVEWPARVDAESHSLRLEVEADDIADCEEFDRALTPEHSDDDAIESMFRPRVA